MKLLQPIPDIISIFYNYLGGFWEFISLFCFPCAILIIYHITYFSTSKLTDYIRTTIISLTIALLLLSILIVFISHTFGITFLSKDDDYTYLLLPGFILFAAFLMPWVGSYRLTNVAIFSYLILWLCCILIPIFLVIKEAASFQDAFIIDGTHHVFFHIAIGFSALAIILFSQSTELPDIKKPGYLSSAISILILFMIIIQKYKILNFNVIQVDSVSAVTALVCLILLKFLRRKNLRIFEMVAIILIIFLISPVIGTSDLLYTGIVNGVITAAIIYLLLDYLNYNEANPAYLVWVIHGTGGLLAVFFMAASQEYESYPLSLILMALGVAAYSFILSFMILGVLNRVIRVKIRDFSDSFQY